MKRLILAMALGLFAVLGVSRAAEAGWNTGYVCTIDYNPIASSSMGSAGYLMVEIFSSPACAGTFLGNHYFASSGNTVGATSIYNTTTLGYALQMAQGALNNGKRLQIFYTSAVGTTTFYVDYQRVWPN